MGYHQKLLLISSLFIVGVGIVLGIQKYHSSMAESNLNALMLDLLHISSKAQAYYFKPGYLNGGGRSFAGLTSDSKAMIKLFGTTKNENGSFQILPTNSDQSIIIQGIGKCDADEDGQNLTVQSIVFPDSVKTIVVSY